MKRVLQEGVCIAAMLLSIVSAFSQSTQRGAGNRKVSGVVSPVIVRENTAGTVIFQEGFNDTVRGHFPPTGWRDVDRDADTNGFSWFQNDTIVGTNPAPPYEGIAFAADDYQSANGNRLIDDYFITPNTGGSAPPGTVDSLVFWLISQHSSSGFYRDSLQIRLSTTGSDTSNFATLLAYIECPKSGWTRYAIQLPAAANRYIAFRYLLYDGGINGANSDAIGLDNVQIIRYSPAAVTEGAGKVPTSFALNQNFPNPFNPSTTIEFELSRAVRAKLTILNVIGEEVATIVNGDLAPGRYTVRFDATALSSGVYFYKLVAGSFSQTKRMLFLK